MTKKILSLIGAASVAASAFAGGYTVTLDNTLVSQYYFRGIEVAGEQGGVHLQPALDVSFDNASVGVWSTHSITEKNDYSEFDFYGVYNVKVSDAFTIPVGATYYYYPTADTSAGLYRGTYEAFVGVTTTVAGVTLSPKAYYDFVLEQWTLEGNASYSLALSSIGTSLDFYGSLGYWFADDVARKSNIEAENVYYTVGVKVPYALTDKAKLIAGVAWTDGLEGELDGDKFDFAVGQIIYSISINASF